MSWKFRLSLVCVIILAAAALLKLPSQADTDAESSTQTQDKPVTEGKFTKYPNGVIKIEPQNFATTGAVRNMPTSDPDALAKGVNFVDLETAREKRAEELREKQGVAEPDEAEINELNTETIKQMIPGAGVGNKDFLDPLLGKSANLLNAPESPQTMPTPSLTFDGATSADNRAVIGGNVLPPDVNGDVGPNHYVSSVNLVLKMFNKSGTIVAGPIKTSDLFAALPAGDPCRVQNDGDPIVLYDSMADRWHISQFGVPRGGNINYQCVALSKTGDPTGQYYVWSYAYPLTGFNDYPKVGVWTDGYHMTFNQFALGSGGFLGLGLLTQDRQKALVGDPTAGAVYVNIGALDQTSGGALPGDIDGFVAPPAGLAEVIGEFRADEFGDPVDGIRMYKWIPNFANPGNSSLTVLADVQLAPFDARRPGGRLQNEQMGGANLDAIAERSMHRFAYRNFGTAANPVNSYVGNFSVNVSGVNPTSAATYQTGIRWFEMRRVNDSFSVFDQGTHNLTPGDGANGLNDWMGSIAQDGRGDIALGFSQAGTTQRADIKIAGRTNNVPSSGTLNEGEALFYAATGSQQSTSGRWGDYSSMSIDPTDDCTFWYTQEYYAVDSSASWSTRVGKFRFPQCVDAPKTTIEGTITDCNTGIAVNTASVNATGGFNRLSAPNGTFSITVSPGTYSLTSSRFGFNSGAAQTTTVGAGQTQTVNFCLTPVAVVGSTGTPQIVSESCSISNGSPDPGEQVTVALPLQNTGAAAATSNLTATLQATGGVTNPSAAQNYGAIAANGSATRNFTFTVNPNLGCGSPITLTFNVNDGTTSYGTITRTYVTGVRTQTFSENFDDVTAPALPANWTNVQILGTSINWVTTTTTPSSAPNAAFANDSTLPSTSALVSPAIQIQTADAQLSFRNKYNTEATFDGMVLEYSVNNGSTWTDILAGGGSFVSGRYNSFIDGRTDSTLRGRIAWSGNSGSYIDTVVNLPASLNGQSVKFRWVMATDTDNGSAVVTGAFIDDVKVFGARQCSVCSSAGACRFQRRSDFDGDGKSDISVYRPSNGVWYSQNSMSGFSAVQFGNSTDKIAPADYDGDGKTDVAVFRDGFWYLQRSSAGFAGIQFGSVGDIPQPADFDGDGKAELALYRPSNGSWYVLNLANNQFNSVQFGISTDKPVVGDYDGDCKADYAVFRDGNWYILGSQSGFRGVQFGSANDKPVVGDYDGDLKTDIAVYRPSNGSWYVLGSANGFSGVQFGISTDLPAPADFDGDGKTDVAVFRDGNWYILGSQSGFRGVQFGSANDKPIPNAYVP